jgi:hypothetical protein
MTTIERFQRLQIELARVGLPTALHADPNSEGVTVSMFVDLKMKGAGSVEDLDVLAVDHGFSYVIAEDSRAAITLARSE